MNTPRTKRPKRFSEDSYREGILRGVKEPGGQFAMGLARSDAAIEFAMMTTEFTHLEILMERFAARLLGTDGDVAAHAMRSIISAKTRIDLMQTLLERARRNSDKGGEFDEIIEEYRHVNRLRNYYVHARYKTNASTGEISWIKPKGDPILLDMFGAYEDFNISGLKEARNRIAQLIIKMMRCVGHDIDPVQPPDTSPLS